MLPNIDIDWLQTNCYFTIVFRRFTGNYFFTTFPCKNLCNLEILTLQHYEFTLGKGKQDPRHGDFIKDQGPVSRKSWKLFRPGKL